MPFKTFSRDEAARLAQLSLDQLDQLLAARLVLPAATADEGEPVFDDANIDELRSIKSLFDAGYGLPEVQKIVRKVGIPSTTRRRERKTGKLLTVGEIARRAGLNPRTIKYWEEQEIISPEGHSDGGFRLYTEDYVLFCQLIRDLQLFGYSLKEIKDTADLFRNYDELSRNATRAATHEGVASFADMLTHIDELRERMRVLRDGIRRWEGFTDKYAKLIAKLKTQAEKRVRAAAVSAPVPDPAKETP